MKLVLFFTLFLNFAYANDNLDLTFLNSIENKVEKFKPSKVKGKTSYSVTVRTNGFNAKKLETYFKNKGYKVSLRNDSLTFHLKKKHFYKKEIQKQQDIGILVLGLVIALLFGVVFLSLACIDEEISTTDPFHPKELN